MIAIGWVLLAGALLYLGDAIPWELRGLIILPALLWAPGDGWARWLSRNNRVSSIQILIDGSWLGLAIAWLSVSVTRELGLAGPEAIQAWWGIALLGTLTGQWVSRKTGGASHTPRREWIGVSGIALSLLVLLIWRSDDMARPLDGYWFLDGADTIEQPSLNLQPGSGWISSQPLGDPEFGALKLIPDDTQQATLVAPMGANGIVVLAAQGPIGSRIAVGEFQNTVRAAMVEQEEEGPVRRYLEEGVAGIRLAIALEPGETLPIEIDAEAVYVFPGTEAIWQVHASGALRWVHYYQILNQVENQVWAREVLDSRRVTLNQPPGWSPLLAISTQTVWDDLPGANALFMWVLFLLGATSVRLCSLIAPGAPWAAWAIPAGMTLSHGLLMLEPMSANFPDSLYAASILGVATALASGRPGWFAFLGVWAQALRWPGGIFATILALTWWLMHRQPMKRSLQYLWSGILAGGVIILSLAWHARKCMDGEIQTGCMPADVPDLADLSFILYFETFPEHWHGEYDPAVLLSRLPEFYTKWVVYTGAGILLALPFLMGTSSKTRNGLRGLLLGTVIYSLFLCTIDHHPTHYFLPLVALTGPIVVTAAALGRANLTRNLLSTGCLLGLLIFLWTGQV